MQFTDQQFQDDLLAGGRRQEQGIRRLYDQYYYFVRQNRLKYRVLDEADVLSAYNSAILCLRNHLLDGRFRGDCSVGTFLNRIFANKCIDLLRQHQARTRRLAPIDTLHEHADRQSDALSRLDHSDQLSQALYCLDSMGGVCKQIFMDSEYWGYASEEIARRVGFSGADSVNSKKYTILTRLRRMMEA
jgi:RNA polymerase sigma factor (sigma-70 family)